MSGLFELIQQQIDGAGVQQIAKSVGVDQSIAQRAVAAALPMILGGMSAHASNPQNAQAIHAEADNYAVTAGTAPTVPPATADQSFGGGLLGKVLGSRASMIQDAVAKAAGIDAAKAGQIIAALTPLVMSALGTKKKQDGLSPNNVQGTLQTAAAEAQARATQQSPGLGGVLGSLVNEISQ
ncbi:MAG: DUF937 domain-containing protein [Gemmatimonadaceae bacterium]